MARFIETLHIRDFRCCKDVKFELTDLHAFVGPNDSGKSTLLEAIREFCGNPDFWGRAGWSASLSTDGAAAEQAAPLARFGVPPIVRLDPDQLRKHSDLLNGPIGDAWFASDRGEGLPAVYDVLLKQNRTAFASLEVECKRLYPSVAEILLENAGQQTVLGVRLTDGTRVLARHISEGMLFYLAYAAMQYLRPTPILLIEEPETGLHPSRIADVVRILREIAKTRQVVLATHSPLLINELAPDEVSVVTRDPVTGTKVTRLKDTPNFEQRASVYALGELWLAYANGTDEAPLLRPVAGESAP